MATFKELKDIIVDGTRDAFNISKDIVKEKTININVSLFKGVADRLIENPKFKNMVRDMIYEMLPKDSGDDHSYTVSINLHRGDKIVTVGENINFDRIPKQGIFRLVDGYHTYRIKYDGLFKNGFLKCVGVPDCRTGGKVYIPFIDKEFTNG